MSSITNFNAVIFVLVGLFCENNQVNSFAIGGIAKIQARSFHHRRHLLVVVDDAGDFASYYEEQLEEGRALANEFQRELKVRRQAPSTGTTMADVDTTSSSDFSSSSSSPTPWSPEQVSRRRSSLDDDESTGAKNFANPAAQAASSKFTPGFFANNSKRYVYSDGTRMRSSAVPLPPKPKYSSNTQLGTSASFAVVILFMRFFWAQALVLGGLICFYLFLAATTTPANNGGVEWLGASLGSNNIMDWFSAAKEGVPVIERTTNHMNGEDAAMM